MENGAKIIAAFLAGAAAGASLGLLLAPDRGEETRKKILHTIDDIGDKASEQYVKYKKVILKESGDEAVDG
ncbi:MAG: hypothetical protein CSB01_00890 [Bacteroidia bacterium]|nr:MAG: hypothetical protein CSB01_00890 [Bacteroidia bacterium]